MSRTNFGSVYEVTTGQKLFPDDWNIREYALKGEPIFPTLWPSCASGSRLYSLGELAQSLLEVDPFNRASAVQTKAALDLIRQDQAPELGKLDCSQGRATQIPTPSPPRNVTVAQVRSWRYPPFSIPVERREHADNIPLVAPAVRTFPGLGARDRQPYQNPFEMTWSPRQAQHTLPGLTVTIPDYDQLSPFYRRYTEEPSPKKEFSLRKFPN